VLLLLAKDKNGSNFSHFTTEAFPGGDVAKIAQVVKDVLSIAVLLLQFSN